LKRKIEREKKEKKKLADEEKVMTEHVWTVFIGLQDKEIKDSLFVLVSIFASFSDLKKLRCRTRLDQLFHHLDPMEFGK
jgi:hypothetical protein